MHAPGWTVPSSKDRLSTSEGAAHFLPFPSFWVAWQSFRVQTEHHQAPKPRVHFRAAARRASDPCASLQQLLTSPVGDHNSGTAFGSSPHLPPPAAAACSTAAAACSPRDGQAAAAGGCAAARGGHLAAPRPARNRGPQLHARPAGPGSQALRRGAAPLWPGALLLLLAAVTAQGSWHG